MLLSTGKRLQANFFLLIIEVLSFGIVIGNCIILYSLAIFGQRIFVLAELAFPHIWLFVTWMMDLVVVHCIRT